MILEVDCQQNELSNGREPYAFRIGKRPLHVNEVQDRWLASHYAYYKVATDDGGMYILRHDERTTAWEMIMFQAAKDANPMQL